MALSIEEFKYQLTRQLKPGPQEQEGISIVIVEHQFIIKSKARRRCRMAAGDFKTKKGTTP